MKKRAKSRLKELFLYGVFGALTTAVNYGSYAGLAHLAGLPTAASNGIAWLLSVAFAFITNKLLVFGSMEMRPMTVLREAIFFTACRLASGALDMGIMIYFIDYAHCNDLIIKLASNVLVILINYVLSKMFVFTEKGRVHHG